MSEIRLLTKSDIPQVMRLNQAAGWNQTERDWARLIDLEPEGCFALEASARLVATATAVCYDRRLAWIGMVLTDPEFRGRGFARRLMEHSLEFLRRREVEWIKLDATDMGRPLYLSLAFEDESPVERWGTVSASGGAPASAALAPFAPDTRLDREAFGADRSLLLGSLAAGESASVPGVAFAMGRPGSKAAFFGPCVSRSPRAARDLLEWFLERHRGQAVCWDLLPQNHEALRLAREFGFAPLRRLARMVRPGFAQSAPVERDDSLVYAIAGFEYG